MNRNEKREKRMYFISDTEYIYFPLTVRSKTYTHYMIKSGINQLKFNNCRQMKCRFVKHMSHIRLNKSFEIPFSKTSATMLYIPHIFH